jgi:hypothetical protein
MQAAEPQAAYLRLTAEGFVVRSLFRLWPLIAWDYVSAFRVENAPLTSVAMAAFDWDGALIRAWPPPTRGW